MQTYFWVCSAAVRHSIYEFVMVLLGVHLILMSQFYQSFFLFPYIECKHWISDEYLVGSAPESMAV